MCVLVCYFYRQNFLALYVDGNMDLQISFPVYVPFLVHPFSPLLVILVPELSIAIMMYSSSSFDGFVFLLVSLIFIFNLFILLFIVLKSGMDGILLPACPLTIPSVFVYMVGESILSHILALEQMYQGSETVLLFYPCSSFPTPYPSCR